MTRLSARRATAGGALGALLGAAALTAAVPSGPVVQAVVSYDGTLAPLPGLSVVASLPALRMAVLRGPAAAMAKVPGTPGVRGLAPDDAVTLTGGRDDQLDGDGGVLASHGLGGAAGRPGAGAGVRVAVVDTGVSDTAALDRASGRLVDAADASGVADGEPVATGGRYDDGFGHGTFMADLVAGGPVAATGGRALGVAPGATVLVVRVARPDGTTSLSRVLGGLDWVAAHADQVDVANLSFSHERPGKAYGADPLTDAVERVRDAGVTVVVSSGNDRHLVGDPGFDPRVLTVGAADLTAPRPRVTDFSGSAEVAGVRKPDVVASGQHLLGLLPPDSLLATADGTLQLPDGLFRGSGTSEATAVASGLAALLLAEHPDATPSQVKASLRCAATDLPSHRDGAGLVSATTALCSGPDGQALNGSGDLTGEGDFDANAWAANAWAANAWAANAWAANAWAANAWAANSWAGNAWGSAERGADE